MNLHEALLVVRDAASKHAGNVEDSEEHGWESRVEEIDKALDTVQKFIDMLKD